MQTLPLVERYLIAKTHSWAKATYTNKRYHLTHFAESCPTLPRNPEPIEAFLATIPGVLYRYNHWCSIRIFYAWARARANAPNPCHLVEGPPKPAPEPYWLEPDQLTRLLTYPGHSKRDRALLWLFADTGMRRGEAHSMTVEGMREGSVYVKGKTGPRWVPVSARVWDMLMEIAPASGPFWRGKRGPLGVWALGYAVWRAFHQAGLVGEKMSSHRLRHSFATLWTGTDADAMDIGGWRDYRTYRIYRTARPARLAESHAKHSPVAQLL